MKEYTHRLFLCVLAAGIALGAAANGQGFQNAKYASEFFGPAVSARSSALGGTGTGYVEDVTAGFYNPAALSGLTYPQGSFLHESRYGGLANYDYLGVALPIAPDQTLALSGIRHGYGDDIKLTADALIDQNGNGIVDPEDRVDPTKVRLAGAADYAIYASYSRKIDDELSVGGNVKIFYRTLVEHSGWGLGVDLSASYKPIENLSLGATLADATKSIISWDTGNQEFVVPLLRLGAAYKYEVVEDHSVMPIVEGIFRFEGRHETTTLDLGIASLDPAAGLEYSFKDRIFVRGGYSEIGQLNVGAGVKLPKLNIDYSFAPDNSELAGFGPSHRISLTLTLEEEKFERAR